ncbi:MAG: tetratricopeptide repeat protein [Desulfarculaceae bacterium]|jgi:predicted negative regulator of RcsB-dependent stress response
MAKIDRKKLLKEPDEFLTFSDRAFRWAKQNLKLVIVSVSAVVLILAVVLGIRAYQQYRAKAASEALAPAFNLYLNTVATAGEDSKQIKAAADSLSQVTSTYSTTTSGLQARLALGSLLLEQEKFKKAEKTFRGLSEEPDLAPELLPLAWRGLAQALEGQNKPTAAAEAFQEAARLSGPSLARMSRLDQARVLAAAGDKSRAAQIYRDLLTKAPGTPSARAAREGLVALGLSPEPASPAPASQAGSASEASK